MLAVLFLWICLSLAAAADLPDTSVIRLPRGDDTELVFYLNRPTREKFPVVFLLQGSEADSMYDRYMPLVQRVLDGGAAAIRIEKRGFAPEQRLKTPEYVQRNTVSSRVLDVQQVMMWVRKQLLGFDGRVGMAGGSEGVPVAAWAASLVPETKALVLLGGGGSYTFRQCLEAEWAATGQPVEKLRSELNLVTVQAPADHPFLGHSVAWWRDILPLREDIFLRQVGCPMLIVHGELDPQTPAASRARLIEEFRQLGRANDLEVRVIHGADHNLGATQAPLDAIDWMLAHLRV